MKHIDVIRRFVNGWTIGKGGHIFIHQNTLYSYGKHFPIAVRLKCEHKDNCKNDSYVFILNKDNYSKTTTRHKNMFIKEVGEGKIIKEVTTGEMGKYFQMDDVRELMIEGLS